MDELTPDQKYRIEWDGLERRLHCVHQLIVTFHNLYDAKDVTGDKKSKTPGNPALQLQIQLYRQEAQRLGDERIRMIQQAYVIENGKRRFRKELFE